MLNCERSEQFCGIRGPSGKCSWTNKAKFCARKSLPNPYCMGFVHGFPEQILWILLFSLPKKHCKSSIPSEYCKRNRVSAFFLQLQVFSDGISSVRHAREVNAGSDVQRAPARMVKRAFLRPAAAIYILCEIPFYYYQGGTGIRIPDRRLGS